MKSEIRIKKWVKRGGMMYATDALDHTDSDHPYNQAVFQGVKPEDFGISHPLEEKYKDYTRSNLIDKIEELQQELLSYVRGYCL